MVPFIVYDCALLTRMSGLPAAVNLRELRQGVAACQDSVIYHHFFETPLRPSFDNPDYRNDFAVWTKLQLSDRVLAERLGIIDPYSFNNIPELRRHLLELIDDRLGEVYQVPSAMPGSEFYFMEATTAVFDTGERVEQPGDLAGAVQRMTLGSVYYHFLEARRREPVEVDDFTVWLRDLGEEGEPYIRALNSIDFYFYGLIDLRRELVRVLREVGGEA
ncbi:MAG: hypothetical protein C4524_12140 [Candidatus Zixiibacteriota bacterium]|nr:MAG: hypothetical protein C4524_12140 [candidate division Zixibacteria bacterium]